MHNKYILDAQRQPVVCEDLLAWAAWFESADRVVARNTVGKVRISTVFLGLDHSFGGPDPILYESMIFGGPLDGEQERYATETEALIGHHQLVARVQAASTSSTVQPSQE